MFAAVPIWAIEECLAEHSGQCAICLAGHRCLLYTALAGSLEDGRLPTEPHHVGDVLPEVLDDLLNRQRRRLNRALNQHADEQILPEHRQASA